MRVPTGRFVMKCTGSLEGGGQPEGLCGREEGPFSWVVQAGEKIVGVLWIVVC